MAKYTVTLLEVGEDLSENESSLTDIIESVRAKVFDFDYELFDPDYKKVLETHFVKRYLMNEIAFETLQEFKLNLEMFLTLNLPYYNKLFESEQLEFDPFENTKMRTESTKNNTEDSTTNAKTTLDQSGSGSTTGETSANTQDNTEQTGENFNRHLEDEPSQNRLGITAQDGVGLINYAKSITEDRNTGTQNKDSTRNQSGTSSENFSNESTSDNATDIAGNIKSLEDYVSTRVGKVGSKSYSQLLIEYRKSFLRIEKTLFAEMRNLFMLVY